MYLVTRENATGRGLRSGAFRRRAVALLTLAGTSVVAGCAIVAVVSAQDAGPAHQYTAQAKLVRSGDSYTIEANDPRPLAQALDVLSDDFEWNVSYEDPPFASKRDVVDSPDPADLAWRAAHPGERGVTIPSGGAFTSTFLYTEQPSPTLSREDILQRLVSDYNASRNPGGFALVTLPNGRSSIVGNATRDDGGGMVPATPILDTVISVPTDNRSLVDSLALVFAAVKEKTGTEVGLGSGPTNTLARGYAVVGGENMKARDLILMAFATNPAMEWRLFYDAGSKSYFLNIRVPYRKY